jgi:SNF2 family DNA or RNA helicase/DNA-binding transcriptional regulator YiaG
VLVLDIAVVTIGSRRSISIAATSTRAVPDDYAERIKRIRGRLGLTQQSLADRLGVSFATVNRWENSQTKPSRLFWTQIERLIIEPPPARHFSAANESSPRLDFTANPAAVLALAEGERLTFGHMANPAFATEISQIDPLPHQRIAVYDHMLKQERLRFLLADDAGAGKTIMTGLYIREMLSRRVLKRILIVAPAGLLGNWKSELGKLFSLPFRVISGSDARIANPFIGEGSDRVIISVDTLASPRVFARLKEANVPPYELVVFDEAHKLAANRGTDLYVRKTDRYEVAEAVAGVKGIDEPWRLPWSAHHLLLLTATPHMGKDYPYFALWRLLEPDVLSTYEAFEDYPRERRQLHFIRRTKEEMVHLDGKPLYPKRFSDTLGYDLTQGPVSEQTLYDETTEYLRLIYNKAKMLNRSAAQLAMSVFQRRLASSTFALLRSFERRIEKLHGLIAQVRDGELTIEQLITMQRRMREEDDILESTTADDEAADGDREENEVAEDRLLEGVVAASLGDLQLELQQVEQLRTLAKQVYDAGTESKFERLREILVDPKLGNEKLIVFTEHRDTLKFLVRRLEGMGYTGKIAQIHGGMHYMERQGQVERFRLPADEGGARFMLCTDAAAEGINLQFCWIMINYDVPWNPARLEQRMGRIHRYGQKAPEVRILNLVAPKTREGRVIHTLLDKLERIRKELRSDKVFDVIGRLFEGVSIKQYMRMANAEDRADEVARELDGKLTKEQVEALLARERSLYGAGGDVARELPRMRESLDREMYQRLLPGYVRQFFERAAPLLGIEITGDPGGCFGLRSSNGAGADPLLQVLDTYSPRQRSCLSFIRPPEHGAGVWIHPGEPLFEAFRELVKDRLGSQALRGAVFVDPAADKPYLFHLALVAVVREADPEMPDLALEDVLDCRLVGAKQYEGAQIHVCPVEHLLLLKDGHGLPAVAQRLAVNARTMLEQAQAFMVERVARELANQRRLGLLATLAERESFVRRGFDFREVELAAARIKQSEKARAGNAAAQKELGRIRDQQKQLAERRNEALAVLRREPELISPKRVEFIAHALVVPSSDPADLEQYEIKTEEVAIALAWAFEESERAIVKDVHTPELALAAGLSENPGFDLLSIRPTCKRSIEVKGRAGVGEVEVSGNEWAKACNLRGDYWLYVAYDCATPNPRLVRVQDPFGRLLAKAKGSVLISPKDVLAASAQEGKE